MSWWNILSMKPTDLKNSMKHFNKDQEEKETKKRLNKFLDQIALKCGEEQRSEEEINEGDDDDR